MQGRVFETFESVRPFIPFQNQNVRIPIFYVDAILLYQIGGWQDCANICKGMPSRCKAWSYRDEPIRYH